MSALVLLMLFPLILGTLRIALTIAGWLVWLLSLVAILALLCLLAPLMRFHELMLF